MKVILPFLYILFLFGCGQSQSDTAKASAPVKDTIDIFLDTVSSISKRNTELTIKEVEELLHEKYFIKNAGFSVTLEKNVTGKLNIYAVKLTGELPAAQHTVYTFVDVTEKHLQFLIPVEFNQLYGIEDRIMVGGIYTSREYEYYSIYELDNNTLKLIFSTNQPNGQTIIIGYFKDDECIDYNPDRLRFQYNEQTNDILFTGNASRYCEPGRDRTKNDKIIERTTLNLVFHYKNATWAFDKKKSHYLTW